MAGPNKVTSEGLKKLKDELESCRELRKTIGERLKDARSQGDLSENSEYDEARDAQSKNETRISELLDILSDIIVVDEVNTNSVSVGVKVKIRYLDFDDEEEFTIVGTTEADPDEGRISDHSPIGHALIGAGVGETVTADTPSGHIKLEVLEINKA